MKKVFLTLFTLLLLVGLVTALNACGNGADTTEPAETTVPTTTVPTTTAPAIPEGYQAYENGDITFAYPEGWTKTDGSTVLLVNEAGAGNNITVVHEAKTDAYASMTTADFNEQMAPAFELMGLTISNAAVTQTENGRGLAITKIAYTATMEGVSMKQTMYIASTADKTYTVTVTETTADAALVQTVFDTLALAE